MICETAACALALMLHLEPTAPWKDTYVRSAESIARVAREKPLFAGREGAKSVV